MYLKYLSYLFEIASNVKKKKTVSLFKYFVFYNYATNHLHKAALKPAFTNNISFYNFRYKKHFNHLLKSLLPILIDFFL